MLEIWTLVEFERNLQLEAINLFPNPSNGWVQVKFMADAQPTTVRFTDINGKEIYKQEMPDFDGAYMKAIDLNKAAKGTVFFTIQQGDKVYS
ncbi:MAG: T9SS type A sorting domain-containing protein [Saprospiraceae bacterium]